MTAIKPYPRYPSRGFRVRWVENPRDPARQQKIQREVYRLLKRSGFVLATDTEFEDDSELWVPGPKAKPPGVKPPGIAK